MLTGSSPAGTGLGGFITKSPATLKPVSPPKTQTPPPVNWGPAPDAVSSGASAPPLRLASLVLATASVTPAHSLPLDERVPPPTVASELPGKNQLFESP